MAGPADAPAIVLVHGTGLSHAAWTPQLQRLADRFRLIAPDLPGHGRRTGEPFTLDGAAAELARLIDEHAGGRAVVVGLSLGGYVAMELAASRPETIRGLVLAGASQDPVGVAATPFRALAWTLERSSDGLIDRAAGRMLRIRYGAAVADPIIAAGFAPAGGAAALRSLVGQRFAPRLARYGGPVLVLNGELDLLFRLGARRFAEAAIDARRVRIARAGHLVNLDRPSAFDAAVRRFVEGLAGRS